MDLLEKIIFIDLTCHQLGIPNSTHPDYVETWQKLSEGEKDDYTKLTGEIHQIWNYINMPLMVNLKKRVNSVVQYHEVVNPVNQKILNVCMDFGISLKEEHTEEFKAAVKKLLGDDYFKWFET